MSDTLTHRALRIEDAAATAELFMAMERAEPVDEAFSEQDMVEEFSGPRADLERGSIGIFSGDRLIAMGWLLIKRAAGEIECTLEGGVHPDYTGRGLGRRVVQELGERAVQIRDADAAGVVGPDGGGAAIQHGRECLAAFARHSPAACDGVDRRNSLPGVLKVGVDELRPRSVALIAAAGYETWRYFLRMRCDLPASLTATVVPAGIEVRPYRPSDDEAVRLVSNESWADHWGSSPMDSANWRAQFAESATFRPTHSRVALQDGTIVGFVLVSEFDADTAQRGYRTGYIGRVGTIRPARGKSIASTLLASSLESLAAAGYRCAELDVDAESPTGAGPLYERAGFVTTGRLRIFGRRF